MLEVIKDNFTHAAMARCSEQHCELRLGGLSHYVVLKGERVCPDRKMCDCIVFVMMDDRMIIGIVELKSRTAHAREVIEKLTNASKSALKILDECGDRLVGLEFYHLVLSKRWNSSEYRVITGHKVSVRGKKYHIIPKRCGTSFAAVMCVRRHS